VVGGVVAGVPPGMVAFVANEAVVALFEHAAMARAAPPAPSAPNVPSMVRLLTLEVELEPLFGPAFSSSFGAPTVLVSSRRWSLSADRNWRRGVGLTWALRGLVEWPTCTNPRAELLQQSDSSAPAPTHRACAGTG
jgi:hypothetical protein